MALEIEVDLGVELEASATITEAGLSVVVTFGQSITIDSTITELSENPVQSAALFTAFAEKLDIADVDTTITELSGNPVQSAAIFDLKEELEADIADLAASTVVYPAASFEKIQGGTVTGTIADAQTANNGSTLRVNEAAGGLTIDFTFAGVEAFNVISLHLRYVGGANHQWEMQLYNYTTASWDVKEETEGTQDYLTWFNISVPQDDAYISGGVVKVRFYHLPNYIASHYVLFDYVAVIASLSVGNPFKENITGLKLADSPEFANTQITTLESDADAGIVPALQATWLGATAKSVLSYLVNILSKLYSHITATANAHPAKAIVVDVAPVANYDKVALNDTGQDLAGKVLGVQDYLIDLTLTEIVQSVTITHDRYGNLLSIPYGKSLLLIVYAPEFRTSANALLTGRASLRINEKAGATDYLSLGITGGIIYLSGTNSDNQYSEARIHNFQRINVFSQNRLPTTAANQVFMHQCLFADTIIASLTVFENWSNFLGIGTRISLKLI